MKMTINGKDYPLTVDAFGLTYVDGKLVDDFMKTLSVEDTEWLARYGLSVVQREPKHFDDIAERIEMPRDLKGKMDRFKL